MHFNRPPVGGAATPRLRSELALWVALPRLALANEMFPQPWPEPLHRTLCDPPTVGIVGPAAAGNSKSRQIANGFAGTAPSSADPILASAPMSCRGVKVRQNTAT